MMDLCDNSQEPPNYDIDDTALTPEKKELERAIFELGNGKEK